MPNTDFDKFAQSLRLQKLEVREGFARVGAHIEKSFLNGVNIAHGGFLFSIADYASALAVNTESVVAVSSNSVINYLNPCPADIDIVAVAKTAFKNPKTAVCDVEVSAADGSAVFAVFQSRFIVRK